MNDLTTASASGNGSAKTATERRVRHGLIEDWRDGLGILILLLVAAFSGALIARYWPDGDEGGTRPGADVTARVASIEERLSNGKATPDIAALKDRVAKLETRLATTEAALAAGGIAGNLAAVGAGALNPSTGPNPAAGLAQLGPDATPEAMRKVVDDIATRLAAVEGKTATTPADLQATKDAITALTTHLDAVVVRLERIEGSDLIALASRASLATAIANLTRAAQASAPFKTEYDAVAAMLPKDETLSSIEAYARQGLPTTGTLIATFSDVSHKAIAAEQDAQGQDWLTKLQGHFTSLISARPVGNPTGNATKDRLARAETRLKAGDLPAAVKEMSVIAGPAKATLTPWLTQAQARVKVETTLAALNTRAVAALASPPPPPPAPTDAAPAPQPKTP